MKKDGVPPYPGCMVCRQSQRVRGIGEAYADSLHFWSLIHHFPLDSLSSEVKLQGAGN